METVDLFFARRTLEKAGAYTEERSQFLCTLMQHTRQGHICLHAEKAPALPSSVLSGSTEQFPKTAVVQDGDRYYLQRNWVYETELLKQVKRLRSLAPPLLDPLLNVKLAAEAKLLPEQKMAIVQALQHSFSLICGGPGTGKTYTAGFLVRLSGALRLAIAAPTGKAAAHLEASLLSQGPLDPRVKVEVGTVHRLLRLQPGESRLLSDRKIDADLVLVDEASMLDVTMLTYLLKAIGPGTRLVLMGDPNQLPPIDAGSLFAEMATLFGSQLKRSMRTEEAHIHALAEAVNQGDAASVEDLLKKDHPSVRRVLKETLPRPELFWEQPDPEISLQNSHRFRILGTLLQGPQGVHTINRQIVQEMALRIRPGQWWAIPILATHNQPRIELYNGMGGILIGKCRGTFSLRDGIAYFPSSQGLRSFITQSPFEVAFCLSVHKSQGSEFERVLALFPSGSEVFGREALYTALTRAKKEIEVCIDETTLRKCLAHRCRRVSGFTHRYE